MIRRLLINMSVEQQSAQAAIPLKETNELSKYISYQLGICGSQGCEHCAAIYSLAKDQYLLAKAQKRPTTTVQRLIFVQQNKAAVSEAGQATRAAQGGTGDANNNDY